ncbi:MAG: cbb3-type cytochrome c oxidase subunit II [Verrucomicrobiae bacterium]|nr:cbb3-type cytochrome c oxidase subunit II [Verrucomicrobiae bacterium]
MNKFRVFLVGLALTFGLPWFFLLIVPTLQMSRLAPLPVYELDENGQKVIGEDGKGNIVSYYPPLSSGSKTKGEEIYVREGCAQCHSQLIRDPRVAMDSYKREWGSVFDSMAPLQTRPTNQRDYLAGHYPVLGIRRLGGDLSNVAYRYGSREQMHLMIYDSRIAQPSSIMPPYRFLYKTRKIEGNGPSVRALALTGDLAPEPGYEVIPTGDAEALVDYLMALKKNYTDPSKPVVADAEAK